MDYVSRTFIYENDPYIGCFDKNVPIQTREHYVIKTFTRITIFNMHEIHIITDAQQNCQLNILHPVCVFATRSWWSKIRLAQLLIHSEI